MHIKKITEADAYAIVMDGKFTFNDNLLFREILESLPDIPLRRILLDMTRLEFIDSAALGMLILAHEKAQAAGKEVAIRGAQGQVMKMLTMARFEHYFIML